MVEEEIPERLIHSISTEDVLYNIVYTGKHTLKEKKLTRQQVEENQNHQKNTVKLEVDLKELSKLYPTLNT